MPTLGFEVFPRGPECPGQGQVVWKRLRHRERGTGSGGFPISSFPTPSLLNLSQPPSTERTGLRTIIRTMVAMTTGVDFVSIFSTDCKEEDP